LRKKGVWALFGGAWLWSLFFFYVFGFVGRVMAPFAIAGGVIALIIGAILEAA